MAGVRTGIFVGTILIWLFIVPFHSLSFAIQEAGGQPLADVRASVDQLQNSTSDHGGGVSFRGLLASPHRAQLTKTNYESVDWKSGFADVLPWASPHRVVLERAKGVARLRSTPDGAEILLDGDSVKTFGTTPHDLTLTAGDHSVLFRKANYSDSKWEPILVPPSGVVDLDRPLQKIVDGRTYPLTVASEPPEAEIYIDGHFRGTTPVELKVGRGSHLVRVTKDGTTRRDNISVPERSIVVFELSKK